MLLPFFIGVNMNIITQAEYKAFANITGAKEDAQIDALITACSSIVEQVLGFSYSDVTPSRITMYANRDTYFLDTTAGINNTLKYTPRSTGVAEDMDASQYILDNSGKLIILRNNIQDYDTITVQSTQSSTIPEDIKLATMLLVKYYYKEEFNKSSIAAGGQQVNYITGNNLPPHVRTLLLLHRVM